MFMESSTAQTLGGGGANKRKKQAELEEKINALYSNIKLFEKSVKVIIGMWLHGCVYLVDLHFAENDFVWQSMFVTKLVQMFNVVLNHGPLTGWIYSVRMLENITVPLVSNFIAIVKS